MSTNLIIAAHPDDEVMGCGGTISRLVAEGMRVEVLFMTDGVGARNSGDQNVCIRRQSAERAAAILGVQQLHFLDFPDNAMDSVPLLQVVKEIEGIIEQVQPGTVYTHHYGDLNIDHRITHQAVLTACRPQPGFCVRTVLTFEVPSSTEWQVPGHKPFTPQVFIDISHYADTKKAALLAYEGEMRDWPHSRSLEGLDSLQRLRGSSVGVAAAEAFMLIRQIL